MRQHAWITAFAGVLVTTGAMAAGVGVDRDLDRARAVAIVNGSFETGGPAWGRSLEAEWGGDPTAFVGPTQGIVPLDGERMVHFQATTNQDDYDNVSSDLWQVIDLGGVREMVRDGRVTAEAWAFVNRVAGGPATDTGFGIDIQAFAGDLSAYLLAPQQHLARSVGTVRSDDDPATWEPMHTTLCIPADADFLVVRIRASENVTNDLAAGELDGHYADFVTVTLNTDECICPADVDTDGMVDVDDLLRVSRRVGARGRGDIDNSGMVDLDDLLKVAECLDR